MRKSLGILVVFLVACGGFGNMSFGQMAFKKVQLRTEFSGVDSGKKGVLTVTRSVIRFHKKNGETYFSIPSDAVTEVFYSRVSGRRIGAAILITPFLLFSKGKKHYMTLSFDDGKDQVGAVEFKLHKGNYRGCLRAIEQVTGKTLHDDQEGVKASEEGVAKRSR